MHLVFRLRSHFSKSDKYKHMISAIAAEGTHFTKKEHQSILQIIWMSGNAEEV